MPYTDFLKDILINYFIFGYNGSLFLCGFFSGCIAQASHCSGFFCCRARAPGLAASAVAACGFSGRLLGSQAQAQ